MRKEIAAVQHGSTVAWFMRSALAELVSVTPNQNSAGIIEWDPFLSVYKVE